MDYMSLSMGLIVVATSIVASTIAYALWTHFGPMPQKVLTMSPGSTRVTAFLFDEESLVDATPEARSLLEKGPAGLADWPRLNAVLGVQFPDLSECITRLGDDPVLTVASADGASQLTAERHAGLTHIEISSSAGKLGETDEAAPSAANLTRELGDSGVVMEDAPFPVWREDGAGTVRWVNSAYIELALRRDPEATTLSWPLPRLFTSSPPQGAEPNGRRRHSLDLPPRSEGTEPETLWFELSESVEGAMRTFFALPADALVRAEESQREFLQTLAKTFAHLPTGLAVFDKDRRLALFNPALTDLSNLPPLFLSRRPTLFEFLDQLREVRRMPEPKDYRDWRQRIGQLETASATGTHIETWTLPDGQVFRVTGRPHPDGAVAFLFQDITSEVSLTRRFRSELELGQSVVDNMEEAVCVFSHSGALVLSNLASDRLWGPGPGDTLAPSSLHGAVERWRDLCQPSPAWREILGFAAETRQRQKWTTQFMLKDGRALACRIVPIAGNATLIGFSIRASARPRFAVRPASSDTPIQDTLADRPNPAAAGFTAAAADPAEAPLGREELLPSPLEGGALNAREPANGRAPQIEGSDTSPNQKADSQPRATSAAAAGSPTRS